MSMIQRIKRTLRPLFYRYFEYTHLGIDFMDPTIFILLFPVSFLFEHILGLRLKGKGYILLMEAQKKAVPS